MDLDFDLERVRPGAKALGPSRPKVTPTLASSTHADAVQVVGAFKSRTGPTRWRVTRADLAKRLEDLVKDPDLVDQGSLNLCGPAAFFHLWARRDPAAFARYVADLFEKGEGKVGKLTVKPSDKLVLNDYSKIVPQMVGAVTPVADWMCLSALRNSEGRPGFQGDPSENLSGLTMPQEVAGWMKATSCYSSVTDEAKWLTPKGLTHALGLRPTATSDILLMINANMIPNGSDGRRTLLDLFPNHYIQLLSPVTKTGNNVAFDYWTWGLPGKQHVSLPVADFEANYFGSITGKL
jgi:hypothetical protein